MPNASNQMKTGGIILAGGHSSRYGKDKCTLSLGGRSLIEIVSQILKAVCADVFVVSKGQNYSLAGVHSVFDDDQRQTPLAGILKGIKESGFDNNIIVACDMPFLNPDCLRVLIDNAAGYESVIPVINGRPEPLHGIYSTEALAVLEKMDIENVKIRDFLRKINTLYLSEEYFIEQDPELLSFFNINTEDDYEKALKLEQGS